MTQKTLGYIELEWTCKRCATKNPGTQKTCSNCGAPMAAEDQFELPDEQNLITDKEKIASLQKGADIHCPYCGARNPAGSQDCVQCGGDLKEGAARQAGLVLGAHQAGPAPEINCPYCAAKVKANSQRCLNCGGDLTQRVAKPAGAAQTPKKIPIWAVIVGVVLLLLCCGAFIGYSLLSARTNDVRAQVQSVSWQRSIEILEQQPVQTGDWEDEVPAGADNLSCEDRYRETSKELAPKSTETCGTPYTVDEGSGAGKVVQDCVYQVYDSYCEYTTLEWVVITQAVAQGDDLQAYWPELNLEAGQREGNRLEKYLVNFQREVDTYYQLELNDPNLFAQFTPGSEWTLKVNSFGTITDIQPE